MTKWDGHGREYAKAHMPISDNAEEQRATLREWDERMNDRAYLRRVKGWVMTMRTHNGRYRFLPRAAHDRGRALREFFKISDIHVDTQTMICGLPTRLLDKFLNEFKPKRARDKHQLQNRIEKHIARTASRMSENAVGWYDDRRAPPFSWHTWDVHRVFGNCWQYERAGSQEERSDQWRRDFNELKGNDDDYVPDWYTAAAPAPYDEWYDPRHYDEAPRTHAPTHKGYLHESKSKMVSDRTVYFDDALVAQMDARNLQTMGCLDQWVQRDVIYTYAPRDDKKTRDINKYLGAVLGCFHRMAQSGLEPEESARRIELSKAGQRMQYHTCYSFGQYGSCKYGKHCKQVHIAGGSESD